MDMMFIHADSNFEEKGVLTEIKSADIEIRQDPEAEYIDNTFSITLDEAIWANDPIYCGDYVYVPNSEWGGVVTLLKHSTEDQTVVIQGATWRGLLFQRRVEPPEGEGYKVLTSVDANEAIRQAVGIKYGSLFSVTSESAGVNVSAQWRYQTVADALHATLRAYGLRLNVTFNNSIPTVILSAEAVDDLTDEIEISQDYGVNFQSETGNIESANHCLALGAGQLASRNVLNVYYYNGQFYTSKPAGLAEADIRTVILDYPNAEDNDELLKSAIERLTEHIPHESINIDQELIDLDAQLGDIIGVRDRLTGMVGTSEISKKILTIIDGVLTIDSEV